MAILLIDIIDVILLLLFYSRYLFDSYEQNRFDGITTINDCIDFRVTAIRCHTNAVGATDCSNTSAVAIVT